MKPVDETPAASNEPAVEPAETPAPVQPTIEDKPAETKPAAPAELEGKPAPKKTTWFQKAVRWVLTAIAFFIAGAAVIYFTYTTPAYKQADALQATATASAQQIATLEANLKQSKSDLQAANQTIADDTAALKTAALSQLVAKMQVDVNTARVALLKLDPASATQALSFAQKDLAALTAAGLDSQSIAGFQSRLDDATQNLDTDPAKAMSALDTLFANLLMLENNLK